MFISGAIDQTCSYRPISILAVPEDVVAHQLKEYFKQITINTITVWLLSPIIIIIHLKLTFYHAV